MTCGADWPEIQSQLRPGQTFADIPVVVIRVFKRKLTLLLQTLKTMFPHAGRPIYTIYSIEFHKRGLPHAHILIKYPHGCIEPNDIDSVISAEILTDPVDAQLVRKYMMHSHPTEASEASRYCQRVDENGVRRCRFRYPFALQVTTTIDSEGRVHYRRRRPGDDMVVAHCLPLLRLFRCHINFEAASTSHLFQYLFKYIHKRMGFAVNGPQADSVPAGCSTRYRISDPVTATPVDEIKDYWDARYLSAGEAVWRIMGFHVTQKVPAVTALAIHLPESTAYQQYSRANGSSSLSSLNRYFLRPTGTFTWDGVERAFDDLTYAEYFSTFRLAKFDPNKQLSEGYFIEQPNDCGSPRQHVILRNSQRTHLSRLHSIRPSPGELFYLRTILQTRPCRSFLEAQTVGGEVQSTFQDASNALGRFADTNESMYAVLEAVQSLRTPRQLRVLFVHLLIQECVPSPMRMWEEFQDEFARDFTLQNNNSSELGLNLALDDISHLLEEYGKTLTYFGLPEATIHTAEVTHELRRWSGMLDELEERANNMIDLFNREQRSVYTHILSAILSHPPLYAFVDGKAGRGKTAMIIALCDKLRSMGEIVIATATSAFAAQLYPGGRTTHSTFKVGHFPLRNLRLNLPRSP
jgi:hypothetical protein